MQDRISYQQLQPEDRITIASMQGNSAAACCTNWASSHASAKARKYLRLRGLTPASMKAGAIHIVDGNAASTALPLSAFSHLTSPKATSSPEKSVVVSCPFI